MQDISRTLEALSTLIAANNRRSKFYLSLAEKGDHPELKPFFTHCGEQSSRFASGLSTWRSAYGGFGNSEKKDSRPWSQIKSLLSFALRQNILAQCEDVENDILRMNKSILSLSFMPVATAEDVQKQVKEFEKSLAKVRVLRERPSAAREVFART